MDQKSWAWKKRSTEKSLIAASNSPRKCEEEEALEVQKLVSEKTDLERELGMLNEKLSSALCECDTKDAIAMKQVKLAEEAIAGWEQAESKAASLKQELDKVRKQKTAFEERTGQLDAALKECMHQSRLLREEHESRTPDTVFKTSEEFKKIKIALDEKLSENSQLIKALSIKEMAIGDLIRYKIQADADFKALRSRVETTEKENASLKYGSRLLEKELDIRNEERELNRREVDAALKQHEESLKRIETLETECQRLRLLVKKRLPGHADLGRMKRDVGLLGSKERIEAGRKKSNLSPASSTESSKCKRNVARDFSDVGSDDKTSYAESLISELDHFKNEKQMKASPPGNLITPDMNHLMDDFAEMEKLVELPSNNNNNNNNNNNITIRKILELLEGINVKKPQDKGYTVRVFQWKTDELSAVLERFVLTCNDLLLNGTCDFGYFAREIASNLEWVVNHCFSIQDVTWARSDWDESRSEGEVEGGWANKEAQISEHESKVTIEDLRSEGDIGSGIEKQRILRQDIEAQVMANGDELREACQKISDLENELENKDKSCRRLEETCHDLKKQINSMANNEAPDHGRHSEKQLQNDWEINAASEKLAECQETILNLGKQLKALASPSDRPLFDKVISSLARDSVLASSSTPPVKDMSRRSSSLLDKMLAEDNLSPSAYTETENDSETGNRDSGVGTNGGVEISSKFINGNGIIKQEDIRSKSDIAVMDIVTCKKNGGKGFFKKLFRLRKRGAGYRTTLLIGCN